MFEMFTRSSRKIDTIDSLREHLQTAIMLEHATIPAYLCGLYTIREGTNAEAARVIQSVVMEEMLHIALAANVLNAIGGKPSLNDPKFIPTYPTTLPHSDGTLTIELAKFSQNTLEIFQAIEKPARAGAKAQADRYHTIGQFYKAIIDGLKLVCADNKYFENRPHLQVGPEFYYGGGGKLIRVNNLKTAITALKVIVEEGEGLPQSIWDSEHKVRRTNRELAHYFRFTELLKGRYYGPDDTPKTGPRGPLLAVDWDQAYDMRSNPTSAAYKSLPDLHAHAIEFNRTYTILLDQLHRAFNGEPALLTDAVGGMYTLKYQAQALIRTPVQDGKPGNAGPCFEYVRLAKSKRASVK